LFTLETTTEFGKAIAAKLGRSRTECRRLCGKPSRRTGAKRPMLCRLLFGQDVMKVLA